MSSAIAKNDTASYHYLVCWNPEYVQGAVEKHLDVIHNTHFQSSDDGSVWWGKFRIPMDPKGRPGEEYEPYGESKYGEEAVEEVSKLKGRIRQGHEVRLYIHNPNPPLTECHVGHIADIHYGESGSLPCDDAGRPACARIPEYYFHHKESAACAGCRAKNPKCRLKHECAFWFKLVDFKPNVQGEHYRTLLDTKTGLKLNFAVTLLFPLLVREKSTGLRLFDPKRKFKLPMEKGKAKWKASFPVVEEAARIREQAIDHFVKTNFQKNDDLHKADFFLSRHLLDDAAMYLSHRYEKLLNGYETLNGDLPRPVGNSVFLKLLRDKKRLTSEQYDALRVANEVRNGVYHGRKTPSENMLLGLSEKLREFKV
jgi:hypothetical protein